MTDSRGGSVAQVLVRDLPDDVVDRLKAKAAGRSLEAHLRLVLAEAAAVDRDELVALADAIVETTRERRQTDAVELVRASRDAGWR
jgi:plasmid stability protein